MRDRVNIVDLLSNPDFITWVKNPNRELDVYWKQWMIDNPLCQKTFMCAKSIVSSAHFKEEEPTEQDYNDTLSKILNHNLNRGYGFYKWRHLKKIAACFIFLFSFAFGIFYFNGTNQAGIQVSENSQLLIKVNPAGQKTQFKLPDGTNVWLNAQSSLAFPQKFSDSVRLVHLQGEAYFEVTENKAIPFIVVTDKLITKVLGTSFNINYNQDKIINVSLLTGKVRILNEGNEVNLNPGEQLSYNRNDHVMTKQNFDHKKEMAWKEGIIYFDDADFMEVVRTLERWYGVKFIIEGTPAADWIYQGTFDNQSLEMVLQRLSFSKGFEYTIEEKRIRLNF